MHEFTITVECEGAQFSPATELRLHYYTRGSKDFYDNAILRDGFIIITGNRTHAVKENSLRSVKSVYYKDLAKALLFAYCEYGRSFSASIAVLEVQGRKESASLNSSMFAIAPDVSSLPTGSVLRKAFESPLYSDTAFKAAANLVLANQAARDRDNERRFACTWRAFNALVRDWTGKVTDFDMLCELRNKLEHNQADYPRSCQFASAITGKDLLGRQINSMLWNNKVRGSVEQTLTDMSDERVVSALKECVERSSSLFKDEKEKARIVQRMDSEIAKRVRCDTDVVRLFVFKYAYYLRNQYFHAERWPTAFMKDSDNTDELKFVCEPLMLMCLDLIELIASM